MPGAVSCLGRTLHWCIAYLGFVECLLVDFLVQRLGDSRALQNAVLAEEQPVLERELGEGEADDQLLPREERPVEPASQALQEVLDHDVWMCSRSRGTTTRVEDSFRAVGLSCGDALGGQWRHRERVWAATPTFSRHGFDGRFDIDVEAP
jgi:hypothetical protein